MAYRIAGFIAAATSLIAGGALFVEASRLALRYADVEKLRVTQVREAALAFTETLAPLRRLTGAGVFLDPAREADRVREALRLAEAEAPQLRRFAVYAADGRLLATSGSEPQRIRGEILAFAVNSGPDFAIGRFRRDAVGLEVLAVARDLPVARRLVAVADMALAASEGPDGAVWSLILQDGTVVSPPLGLPAPVLASEGRASVFAQIGRVIMTLGGAAPAHEAPLPGTDAVLRVILPPALGPVAATGAMALGGILLVFSFALGAWMATGLVGDLRALRASHDNDARLQRILAAIAQDARTPLNSIYGFATLLTDNDLHPEQAEWASR